MTPQPYDPEAELVDIMRSSVIRTGLFHLERAAYSGISDGYRGAFVDMLRAALDRAYLAGLLRKENG